jgi:hypothetical protein
MFELSQYKTTLANKRAKNSSYSEGSLYKGIPIEYLEQVRAYFKSQNITVTIRYRGSRTNPGDIRDRSQRMQDCLKKFASTFAVYR